MALCCCGKKDSDSHVVIRGSSNEAFVPSESNAEPLRQSKCHKESPAWESVLCELKDKCDKISLSEDELVSENSIVCSFKMLKSPIVPQSDVVDSRPAFQSLCLAAIRLTAKEDEGKAPFDNDLLINSNMSNVVPSIGKPAPIFKGTAVVNGEFKEISLSDYKGKYVVLFFYPLDFTFVCPTEIIAFSDRVKEFKKIDCEVIACSTDSHFSHLAWVNTSRKEGGLGHMDIPLLADKNMEIAKSYGVLKEDDGVAFRGLFIIDTKHNLRQATINDLPVGRDVDETLRLVQAFQFTDVNGEVCPAGWKPGSKTMKADPHQSKTYFASVN